MAVQEFISLLLGLSVAMLYLIETGQPRQFKRERWRSEFVLPDVEDFPLGNCGAEFLRVKCKRDWRHLKKLCYGN